jgi:hypothetical protein
MEGRNDEGFVWRQKARVRVNARAVCGVGRGQVKEGCRVE